MADNIRRITSAPKRANLSAGNDTFSDDSNVIGNSDTVAGLSDDVINPAEFAGNEDNGAIDPDAPYGRKADGTPRKRRGRQAGSGQNKVERQTRASKKEKGALGIEGLSSILCNLTIMVASVARVPEAALSNEETTLISNAMENVAQFYDFSLNSKAVAWANLAMTVGGIAGAHIVAYKMRRENERRQAA